ncbi:MAG: hypothetical protein HOE48_03370 [Candidatus Latescibacteria bacterium]|jgi:hypothetical protein|nr:hypothetical protein [Candidatus Latescibacterota bacterium]MBT4136925.1 hypothetical protein [Candidatus Latescibacterota bacterium]
MKKELLVNVRQQIINGRWKKWHQKQESIQSLRLFFLPFMPYLLPLLKILVFANCGKFFGQTAGD